MHILKNTKAASPRPLLISFPSGFPEVFTLFPPNNVRALQPFTCKVPPCSGYLASGILFSSLFFGLRSSGRVPLI